MDQSQWVSTGCSLMATETHQSLWQLHVIKLQDELQNVCSVVDWSCKLNLDIQYAFSDNASKKCPDLFI